MDSLEQAEAVLRSILWPAAASMLALALLCVGLTSTLTKALLPSQILLNVQLPISIVLLVHLTSSRRVMGTHANPPWTRGVQWVVAAVVIALKLMLPHSVLS